MMAQTLERLEIGFITFPGSDSIEEVEKTLVGNAFRKSTGGHLQGASREKVVVVTERGWRPLGQRG